jgi:hypothetical protein
MKENSKNYILGGGPAGLAAAYYLKDFKVIDKNPLGQLNTPFIPGPRLLQYTPNMMIFIRDVIQESGLGMVFEPIIVEATIGYERYGLYGTKSPEGFKAHYTQLTRNKISEEDSYLSEGKTKIKHIIFKDLDEDSYLFFFKKLKEILEERNQIINASVVDISTISKSITYTHHYTQTSPYTNLINTINLNILQKINPDLIKRMSNEISNFNLDTTTKCFYKCSYDHRADKTLRKSFSYIYSVSGEYTRKTYFPDYIVYESMNAIKGADIGGNNIEMRIENLPIQIKDSMNLDSFEGIKLLGRYAEWNHKVKLNEVVDSLIDIKEELYAI